MNIDIPEEFINEFELRRGMLREVLLLGLRQLRINEALLLYKQGVVSFGRAAELAKLSRQDMIQQARVAGVEPRWSEDMLRAELA
jgi:predicted HTH domain antitoxin